MPDGNTFGNMRNANDLSGSSLGTMAVYDPHFPVYDVAARMAGCYQVSVHMR